MKSRTVQDICGVDKKGLPMIVVSGTVRNFKNLRLVQTQAILFLKSMSEGGGSDMERL